MESKYFSKNNCIEKINKLKKFYKTEMFKLNNDKELELLKNVIESCNKQKCPIGYYYLYGECLHG